MARSWRYKMSDKPYFIHPTALVATDKIKKETRIWAFCNIQKDVEIGEDCNICDHCSIESGVKISDRVTVKNGVALWDGMTIEDDVFIGPNAVFTNDIYPRSKVYHSEVDKTLIKKGASVGANAVIVAGITIGSYAFIGAGAVLTKDVSDYTLWYGNPAEFQGYVCRCGKRLDVSDANESINCQCGLKYKFEDQILVKI